MGVPFSFLQNVVPIMVCRLHDLLVVFGVWEPAQRSNPVAHQRLLRASPQCSHPLPNLQCSDGGRPAAGDTPPHANPAFVYDTPTCKCRNAPLAGFYPEPSVGAYGSNLTLNHYWIGTDNIYCWSDATVEVGVFLTMC